MKLHLVQHIITALCATEKYQQRGLKQKSETAQDLHYVHPACMRLLAEIENTNLYIIRATSTWAIMIMLQGK